MKRSRMPLGALILGVGLHAASCFGQQAGTAKTTHEKHWEFEAAPVWQDEFDYTGAPDPAKWGYDIGGDGWGNNELQYYTDSTDNAFAADGVLTIAARKEKKEGRDYTSARVVSKGKGDFLYGRFEIKAKLPSGKGTWPALWMLPTDQTYGGWPNSGEIDIMEHVGYDPNRVHITMHTQAYNHTINTQRTGIKLVDGAIGNFHVYRTDWTPDAIRGYIDDELVLEFPNEGTGPAAWPFDQRFHFLINIAVGGNWGGKEGVDDDSFPARMQVDYVRVYRLIEE
ncbi:MAG TPA: glycoside hydrolase family 16 protein [Pseudoxanthomonas sp.]|nr:glycoside hydrolase family 16 protein [Pseudoxanthomonas sp.]